MRHHRPLLSFCASREAEETADKLNRSSYSGAEDDIRQSSLYLTDLQKASRVKAATYNNSGTSIRDATGHKSRSSLTDCSSIPFYSEPSPSLVAVPVPSYASATHTAASPKPFYDGPSLRDSIPALLQKLRKKKQASSFAFTKNAILGRHQQQQAQHTNVGSTSAPVDDAAFHPSIVLPEQLRRPSAATARTLGSGVTSAQSTLSPSSMLDATDARWRGRHGGAALRIAQQQPTQNPHLRSGGFETPRSTKEGQGTSSHHVNKLSGTRYVVMQPSAVVHVAGYDRSSKSTSSVSTTELSSAPIKAKKNSEHAVPLLDADKPITTGPHDSSATRSRRSTSRDVSSSHEQRSSRSTDVNSMRGEWRSVSVPSQRKSDAAYSADHEAYATTFSGRKDAPSVASPSPTHIPAAAAADEPNRSDPTPYLDIQSSHSFVNDSSIKRGTHTPSPHISPARMRNLFASILGKARTTSTTGSSASNASTHASTPFLSDIKETVHAKSTAAQRFPTPSVHSQKHTYTASPPPSKPLPQTVAVGAVESRDAGAAMDKSKTSNTGKPFADAVMEGGDPLVLRHTIDYLLRKTWRLEKENSELWRQTHSWNPHRRIITPEVATVEAVNVPLSSQPLQRRVAAAPQKAAQKSDWKERSNAKKTASVTATIQREHNAPPQQQQPRIFVQRQRRSTAAGRSGSSSSTPFASLSSPSSSASSSITSTPVKSYHSVHSDDDAPKEEMKEKDEENVYAKPSFIQHGRTVPPPPVAVGATTPNARKDASASTTTAEVVQHEQCESRDTGLVTSSSPPQQLFQQRIKTSQVTPRDVPSSRTTPQIKSVLSPFHTPVQRSLNPDESRGNPLVATPSASTLRSHHGMESCRSIGSMALHTPQLRDSVSQTQHTQDRPVSSIDRRRHANHKANAVERSASTLATGTGGTAMNTTTINTSCVSLGRPPTHNKQVQTASILSPAEESIDSDTALASSVNSAATTTAAEQTSIVELHTSAAYSRHTVRRLRAYCSALETTRQQLLRRLTASSHSRMTSVAESVAGTGGSRVCSSSIRSSSQSISPLPRSLLSATYDRVGTSSAAAKASSRSSSALSRPFFNSPYADPEVDATMHDVEETPAVKTMIVLQEDGSGTVTKRVVSSSPPGASVSVDQSSISASQTLQDRHPLSPVVSSIGDHNGLDVDTYSSSWRGSSCAQRQLLAWSRTNARHGSQRASPFRSLRSHNDASSGFNSSLRSDGLRREVVPGVHLGWPLRSDSAASWALPAHKDVGASDTALFVRASSTSLSNGPAARGRFAVPSSSVCKTQEKGAQQPKQQHRQQFISASRMHSPPLQPSFSQEVERQARETLSPKPASIEAKLRHTSDAPAVVTRVESLRSQRFFVPNAHWFDAEVRAVSSSGSCCGNSSDRNLSPPFDEGDRGSASAVPAPAVLSAPSPPPSPTQAAGSATMWNPKVATSPVCKPLASAPPNESMKDRRSPDVCVKVNPVPPTLDRRIPMPPPLSPSPVPSSTVTASSRSSSRTYSARDVSINTPKELGYTSAAPVAHDSACDPSKLHIHAREKGPSDPSSPASRSSFTKHDADADGGKEARTHKRSATRVFLDEANRKDSIRELVLGSDNVVLSPFLIAAANDDTREEEHDEYCDADSFFGSEVEEADELIIPEPMPIVRESKSSEVGHSRGTPPGQRAVRERLLSPSLPHTSSSAEPGNDEDDANRTGSSQAEGEESALGVSEISNRGCHLTMPPEQRPHIVPPSQAAAAMVVAAPDQDRSPSTNSSRSLHSFSSSSSDLDEKSGNDGTRNAEGEDLLLPHSE